MTRFVPTPIAKIARPSLPGVVARPRLFAALRAASPVAWVTGAPGAGKTSLAASFCDLSNTRALWYRVDAGDGDPATFFHFMQQLAASMLQARASLPSFPAESGVDLAVFARRFFQLFFAALPGPATWVIDNFQDAGDPSLTLILREAIQQAPHGMTLIVLSLVDPPPLLARLAANGLVRRIDASELRFTKAECDDVVRTRLPADASLVSELHEKSSGWAAGFVLMIDHLRRTDRRTVPAIEESQSAVFDYFAEEILAACCPRDQRTLMLTAMLPRVTARVAEALSGQSDAGLLLERLNERHLFVERHSASEPSYEYHRLFKIFLCARAQEVLDASDRAGAASRAAALLEQEGQGEDAISAYIAAGNHESAAGLILREARRLHDEGRSRTLADWIAALPPRLLETQPWIAYWAGACQVWSGPGRARPNLELSFRRFAALHDLNGQILAAGALTRACILDPNWALLDEWIDVLDRLLSEDTATVEPEVLLAGLSRFVYVTLARRPGHPRLAARADRTRALLGGAAEPSAAVMAGYSLLFYFTWTGQASEGEWVLRQIAPLAADAGLSSVNLAHWLFAQGNFVLRFGDPGDALTLMDRALGIAAANGLTIEGVIRRHRIAHLLTLSRIGEAQIELDRLAELPRVEPYFELCAWLAWLQGRSAVALDEAKAALQLAGDRGRTFYRILDLWMMAAVAATSGDAEGALSHLRSYRCATAGTPGEFADFQALLIEAFVERSRGADDTCRTLLGRALEIGKRQRYRSCWGWSPALMVPLLDEALARGIEVEYCSELVRTHHLRPPSLDAEHWPWPVRIRTLGRFAIELDGTPLRFEGKAQRKPLTMLKILTAARDHPLAIDELIDLLWPSPEDGGRKAFDITVHRLRKMLGCDAAVSVADRHASLDTRFVWVDAWALERLLDRLVPVAGQPAGAQLLESAGGRALTLFGGSFLAGETDAPWALEPQHRLTSRMQHFAMLLGAQREAAGHWQSAGELYQRMIELDPLAESFYRRSMICLQAQARRADAVEVFRRCRHVLSTRLGIAPCRETEQLYRELVAP